MENPEDGNEELEEELTPSGAESAHAFVQRRMRELKEQEAEDRPDKDKRDKDNPPTSS